MGEQIIVSSVLEAVLWFKKLMLAAERYDRTDIRLETNYKVQNFNFWLNQRLGMGKDDNFRGGQARFRNLLKLVRCSSQREDSNRLVVRWFKG